MPQSAIGDAPGRLRHGPDGTLSPGGDRTPKSYVHEKALPPATSGAGEIRILEFATAPHLLADHPKRMKADGFAITPSKTDQISFYFISELGTSEQIRYRGNMAMAPDHSIGDDGWQKADPWITDQRPSLLIVAPSAEQPEMNAMASGAGFRVTAAIHPDTLAQRLALIVGIDAFLIDLRGLGCDDPRLATVLNSLLAWPAWPDVWPLMLVDFPAAEMVAGMLHLRLDRLLCEPAPSEIGLALCMAAREMPAATLLRDVGREADAIRLEELSAEVRRLAHTIDRLARSDPAESVCRLRETETGYTAGPSSAIATELPRKNGERGANMTTQAEIRTLLQLRRMRDRFLPGELFADPAWDMMLDLMGARLDGKTVSVSSLCIAAAVPPTTALRWISQLTERGLFERRNDPDDARRVFISLSNDAAERLSAWFAAVRRAGLRLTS